MKGRGEKSGKRKKRKKKPNEERSKTTCWEQKVQNGLTELATNMEEVGEDAWSRL